MFSGVVGKSPANLQGTPTNLQETPTNPQGTPTNPRETKTNPQGTLANPQETPMRRSLLRITPRRNRPMCVSLFPGCEEHELKFLRTRNKCHPKTKTTNPPMTKRTPPSRMKDSRHPKFHYDPLPWVRGSSLLGTTCKLSAVAYVRRHFHPWKCIRW